MQNTMDFGLHGVRPTTTQPRLTRLTLPFNLTEFCQTMWQSFFDVSTA